MKRSAPYNPGTAGRRARILGAGLVAGGNAGEAARGPGLVRRPWGHGSPSPHELGEETAVRIRYADRLERGLGGKLRFVGSEVPEAKFGDVAT